MKRTFNLVNLELYKAVEVVFDELHEAGQYKFDLACKDGFYNVLLMVEEDGQWGYGATEIKFPNDEAVLVKTTKCCEDWTRETYEEIMPRKKFEELKTEEAAWHEREDDGHFNGYIKYEDVLANW